ncbi:MAG: phosphoribosyltransferase family protein [Nitrososphaerales archaeon]
MPKLRFLSWSQYGELVTKLSDEVAASGERFDLVIGIARGGIPVAMVVSDRLGSKVDFINVKSYTDVGERVKPRILTTIIERITEKRVLLVDDLVDGGETMETVTRYLETERPLVMKTAVLFTKPWSSFVPDFSLQTVDTWIVFPYERGEVRRSRAQRQQNELVPGPA